MTRDVPSANTEFNQDHIHHMSNKLDQCCDRLKDEIKTVESNLAQAGEHLTSAAKTGVDALEARLHASLTKWDATKNDATAAGQRIRHFIQEVKDNAVTKFEDWKTDREIGRLEKDADRKEQHAADAILVAAFSILEAELAIVEALKARKIAMEVAG